MDPALLNWLITGGLGPALVALPVNWTAGQLGSAAHRWFERLRHADGLSRLVSGASVSSNLTRREFRAVRQLLEDPQTWQLLGGKTVEDLALKISECLRGSKDTVRDPLAAARVIARGLLEFTAADLDPELFQQVLLARLDRMETKQASDLDEAMLGVHADLAVRFAQQSETASQYFAHVIAQLARALDHLPPGPADRGEIAVYLGALIKWLNVDPWPRDRRFKGPVLTPASIERKLRVTDTRGTGERDLDADELARTCGRLVVLGGPGSGKTWLAKRTARRCAEDALLALTAGMSLDEIELPLYTTCSRLFGASGNVREAAVASALDHLGDLGSSRISTALRVFLAERNAATLLVIDSLDEAHGSDERLRQVDTLPWRVVLMSRPSSWNHQLDIGDTDDSGRIGALQPLRYPSDVEPFIALWFSQRPDWGQNIAAQIARQPMLQRPATIPLILAFYCIVGGDRQLPEFRHDLYTRVLKRMLTGRWRAGYDRDPDVDACLSILRDWAWSGAVSSPVSGIGEWVDDIPTMQIRVSEADRYALDHVATALGPADVDTGITIRRFIHRSIREHLVAQHVARLPVREAAMELLAHVWYDADWEYAGPAALVMHPEHDLVLKELICTVARSRELPRDISDIDACWELREFLAAVAQESSESHWSADAARLIGKARIDLVTSRRLSHIGWATDWKTSNARIRDALLNLMTRLSDSRRALELAELVVGLDPSGQDRSRIRDALLGILARQSSGTRAREVAEVVAGLDPYGQHRSRIRDALLGILARQISSSKALQLAEVAAGLDPSGQDRSRIRDALLGVLARQTYSKDALELVKRLTEPALTVEERRRLRNALMQLMARRTDCRQVVELAQAVIELGPTAAERERIREILMGLLARKSPAWGVVPELAEAVTKLDPTAAERSQAREILLEHLSRGLRMSNTSDLVPALAGLAVTTEEQRQVRERLLGLLDQNPGMISSIVGALAQPTMTVEESRQVREFLLSLMRRSAKSWDVCALAKATTEFDLSALERGHVRETLLNQLAQETYQTGAYDLAQLVLGLDADSGERERLREMLLGLILRDNDGGYGLEATLAESAVTAEERGKVREMLLDLLARQRYERHARELATVIAGLAVTGEERDQVREMIVSVAQRSANRSVTRALAQTIAELNPTVDQRRRLRETLLGLSLEAEPWMARLLTKSAAELAVTAEERDQVLEMLLSVLRRSTDNSVTRALMEAVTELDLTAGERSRMRQALLDMLARDLDSAEARALAKAVTELDPTAEERTRVRESLLGLLPRQAGGWNSNLVQALVQLHPTLEEQRRARDALLTVLDRQTDSEVAQELVSAIAVLNPSQEDLRDVRKLLLKLLGRQTDTTTSRRLAELIAQLNPTVAQREQLREVLCELFTLAISRKIARELTALIVQLARIPEEKVRTCEMLLRLLGSDSRKWAARTLAEAIVHLAVSAEEQAQVRKVLLRLLSRETPPTALQRLMVILARLEATTEDLQELYSRAVKPSTDLLVAARRNSTISSWIAILPLPSSMPAGR